MKGGSEKKNRDCVKTSAPKQNKNNEIVCPLTYYDDHRVTSSNISSSAKIKLPSPYITVGTVQREHIRPFDDGDALRKSPVKAKEDCVGCVSFSKMRICFCAFVLGEGEKITSYEAPTPPLLSKLFLLHTNGTQVLLLLSATTRELVKFDSCDCATLIHLMAFCASWLFHAFASTTAPHASGQPSRAFVCCTKI